MKNIIPLLVVIPVLVLNVAAWSADAETKDDLSKAFQTAQAITKPVRDKAEAAPSPTPAKPNEIKYLLIELDQRRQTLEACLRSDKHALTLKGRELVYEHSSGKSYAKAQAEFLAYKGEFYVALVKAADQDPSNVKVKEIAVWAKDTLWIGIKLYGPFNQWYDSPIISEQEYYALNLK